MVQLLRRSRTNTEHPQQFLVRYRFHVVYLLVNLPYRSSLQKLTYLLSHLTTNTLHVSQLLRTRYRLTVVLNARYSTQIGVALTVAYCLVVLLHLLQHLHDTVVHRKLVTPDAQLGFLSILWLYLQRSSTLFLFLWLRHTLQLLRYPIITNLLLCLLLC